MPPLEGGRTGCGSVQHINSVRSHHAHALRARRNRVINTLTCNRRLIQAHRANRAAGRINHRNVAVLRRNPNAPGPVGYQTNHSVIGALRKHTAQVNTLINSDAASVSRVGEAQQALRAIHQNHAVLRVKVSVHATEQCTLRDVQVGELAAGMRVKDRELRGDELAVGEDLGAEHLNEAVASSKDRRAGAAELRAGNLPVASAGASKRSSVRGLGITVHGGNAGCAQVRIRLGVIGGGHGWFFLTVSGALLQWSALICTFTCANVSHCRVRKQFLTTLKGTLKHHSGSA